MKRFGLAFRALFASVTTVLALVSCRNDQGALMVVVSTDMLVPNDISWLRWSVTLEGGEEPLEAGALQLDANELPATLAIHGGPKTAGSVVVELEGAIVEHGDARVRRAAEVAVRSEGVKALEMPLSWACSEANLPEGCPEGQTCVAGVCEDDSAAGASVTAYTEPQPSGCFDTLECFESSLWNDVRVADSGRFRGSCVNGGDGAAAAPDVNVAVIVNSSAVGNYGVCQSADSWNGCLVPLDRGGPNGWQLLEYDGDVHGIGLPDWVCEQRGRAVVGVAVAPLADNARCAVKTGGQALCPVDAICIDADTCPPDWPSAWLGMSCHATESPDLDAYLRCGEDGPGRWCCTNGQTLPEDTDPRLIDDMSFSFQLKVTTPADSVAGFWWANSDDPFVDLEPAPYPGLFTYRDIDPPATPEEGPTIDRAACLRGEHGFQGRVALLGANLALTEDGAELAPFDVRAYSGIRFWARATPNDEWDETITIQVADQNTDGSAPDPTCAEPGQAECGNHWGSNALQLTDDWVEYQVVWDDLYQFEGWGAQFASLDRERVYNLMFEVTGLGPDWQSPPFDFCVAHLYFTE